MNLKANHPFLFFTIHEQGLTIYVVSKKMSPDDEYIIAEK